ncbi:MAG: GAF domain-containing protein [Blastocatellia bacterium]|nr:GAF domain-containing protein [Blastocatellia bacterium]
MLSQIYFGVALGPLLGVSQVAARCCEGLRQALGTSAVRLCLWEDENRTLRVVAESLSGRKKSTRSSDQLIAPAKRKLVGHGFDATESPFFRTLLSRAEPFVFPETPVDDLPAEWSQFWLREAGCSALLLIPLRAAGRSIGVLTVESTLRRNWSEGQTAFLPTVAAHVVTSLEAAQNFAELEQDTHRLNVINEISRSLNAGFSIDEIFRVLVSLTRTIVEFDFASLLLSDSRSNQLKLYGQALYDQSWFNFGNWLSAGFALCGRALSLRQPLVIPRLDQETRVPVRSDWLENGFRSCACVPMLVRGKTVGVLLFLSRQPESFRAREVDNLRQIGEQAGAAFYRVRIFDESEKRSHAAKQVARREELSNRIGMAISSQLHPDMVLQHAVDALGTSMGADACFIVRCLPSDMVARPAYEYHTNRRYSLAGAVIPVKDNPTLQQLLASSDPLTVTVPGETRPDVPDTPAVTPPSDAAAFPHDPMQVFLKELGVHSALYSAIYIGGEAVGFLGLHQYGVNQEWDSDDTELVRAVTRQIAVALGNAQLFLESERNRQELANLFEMSRVLASHTDLRELYGHVTEQVAQSLHSEICLIAAYDRQTELVTACLPGYNIPPSMAEQFVFVYTSMGSKQWEHGPKLENRDGSDERIQRLLVSGQYQFDPQVPLIPLPHPDVPYLSNDAFSDPHLRRGFIRKWGLRNLVLAPLRLKGTVIGFIYVANSNRGFTREDLQVLEIFAAQAAESIVNAQLFEKMQAQSRRDAVMNRILTGLRESLDPDTIMENVVEQLGKALGVDRCTIAFFSSQQRSRMWPGVHHEYCAPGIFPLKDSNALRKQKIQMTAKLREPLIFNDFQPDSLDGYARDHHEFQQAMGIRSLMVIPILQSNETIGTIGLHQCQRKRVWTAEDLDLALQVATQLSVAIQNARLFRRVVASQQQWQASFNAMTDGVALLDAEGRILQANQSLARLCGLPGVEALVGQSGWTLVIPKQGHTDEPPISEVHRTKVSVQAEFVDVLGRIVRETVDPIQDEDGNLMGMVMVLSDVTHERQAEQEIRQRNRELSALNAISKEITKSLEIKEIVQSAFEKAVTAVQADAGLVLVLDELKDKRSLARALPGVRVLRMVARYGIAAETVSSTLKRLQLGKDYALLNELEYPLVFERLLDTSSLVDSPFRDVVAKLELGGAIVVPLQSKNRVLGLIAMGYRRERNLSAYEIQLLSAIGRQVGVAVENAQLISNLQDALREVREVNRLKDEFLATLSHELRTPLTSVTGWSEVLIERARQYADPELQEGIETINQNAENLKQLINDLLDLSRVENRVLRLDLEPVHINVPMLAAVQTVKQMAENKGVRIEVKASVNLPLVNADVNRMQQVFWNLLTNAIKFTEPGGVVTIGSDERDSQVIVNVTDNGIGIERSFLPFVFDRFRQADGSSTRRFGGLGIGLSLVKSFTEAHGGNVTVESQGNGMGSTFEVRLPALEERVEGPVKQPSGTFAFRPVTADHRALPPQVLIVDDLEDNVRLLESTLQRQGFGTLVANSADAGLRLAEKHGPDVVLIDLGIPGMGSLELFRRMQSNPKLSGTPVVGIVGIGMEEERIRAGDAGFRAFITKPFRRRDLIEIVQSVSDGKR